MLLINFAVDECKHLVLEEDNAALTFKISDGGWVGEPEIAIYMRHIIPHKVRKWRIS